VYLFLITTGLQILINDIFDKIVVRWQDHRVFKFEVFCLSDCRYSSDYLLNVICNSYFSIESIFYHKQIFSQAIIADILITPIEVELFPIEVVEKLKEEPFVNTNGICI